MAVYYFYDSGDPVPFYYLTPTRMAGQIPPPYDTSMSPSDYLEFAIADFAEGSDRGLVNAFGNAKRALHLAIDTVLHQYGLFSYYGKTNFPTKLQILDEIGILPTNIIKNLNVERNLIEHEYDTPPKKRVGEAIDVVKLLLLAIEKLMEATPHEVVVGWKNPNRHCVLQLEPNKGVMNLFTLKAKGKHKKSHGINYFCGSLRTLDGGKLLPGIEIAKAPWKTIKLVKSEIGEWKSIIAELVNVQRKRSTHKMKLDKENASITIPITVPLPEFKDRSWAKIMDDFLSEKFETKEPPSEQKQTEDAPREAAEVSTSEPGV